MRVVNITANITAGWMLCAAIAMPAFAEDPAPGATEPEAAAPAQPAGPVFKYQTGNITLPNKVATLHLGEKYRYLDASETNKLLMAWGNESDNTTQGAIIPAEVDPLTESGWAVILTYDDDGHIDDADAKDIDYDDMLKDMKEGTEDHNKDRKQAGFEEVHLVGWAEKPHYDVSAKKLYWAKELNFEGTPSHTLNYDVRVLGREGVLSMNAVASMNQLEQIRGDMRPLIDVAEFNEGYRYAEFNSKTDKLAEYGLGALIAGGVAAKLGLFAKLGALLLAFKKLILVGIVAIGGGIAKLFGKKKDTAA
ncbi:MAG: DUF2167 domain-containing protein [Pseudomonadota bacterium]